MLVPGEARILCRIQVPIVSHTGAASHSDGSHVFLSLLFGGDWALVSAQDNNTRTAQKGFSQQLRRSLRLHSYLLCHLTAHNYVKSVHGS